MKGGAPRCREGRSWQVTPAVLRTPGLALAMILALLAIGEAAARHPAIRGVLHPPSVGSSSRRFELQLDALGRFVDAGGPLDCLILGNSTALMGVDPEVLGAAYRARIGEPLRCFNFGVAGMTGSAAGAVAPILVQRYRPRLVLYIASARDVGRGIEGPQLADDAWVRYQRGTFSPSGWLATRSSLIQYYLLYRQWLDPSRWPAARSSGGTTPAGFFPIETRLGLSAELWARTQKTYAAVASQPVSAPQLIGFTAVLALAGTDTQMVVIEPPAHLRLRHWAHRITSFYSDAIASMRAATRRSHVPFWRTPLREVPPDGWVDFVHLHRTGATRFSMWVGDRVAAAVQRGRLRVARRQAS